MTNFKEIQGVSNSIEFNGVSVNIERGRPIESLTASLIEADNDNAVVKVDFTELNEWMTKLGLMFPYTIDADGTHRINGEIQQEKNFNTVLDNMKRKEIFSLLGVTSAKMAMSEMISQADENALTMLVAKAANKTYLAEVVTPKLYAKCSLISEKPLYQQTKGKFSERKKQGVRLFSLCLLKANMIDKNVVIDGELVFNINNGIVQTSNIYSDNVTPEMNQAIKNLFFNDAVCTASMAYTNRRNKGIMAVGQIVIKYNTMGLPYNVTAIDCSFLSIVLSDAKAADYYSDISVNHQGNAASILPTTIDMPCIVSINKATNKETKKQQFYGVKELLANGGKFKNYGYFKYQKINDFNVDIRGLKSCANGYGSNVLARTNIAYFAEVRPTLLSDFKTKMTTVKAFNNACNRAMVNANRVVGSGNSIIMNGQTIYSNQYSQYFSLEKL